MNRNYKELDNCHNLCTLKVNMQSCNYNKYLHIISTFIITVITIVEKKQIRYTLYVF